MRKILFLLGFLFAFSNIHADNIVSFKVCVYDECTGEPIPGWTVNLFDSGPCSVEKCEIFRIADNCPFCLKSKNGNGISFKLAPNPVSDVLYLSATDESNLITIIDFAGRQIYHGVFRKSVDVSMWNTGFYFARYYDQQGNSHVEKFFKQ